MTDSRSAKLGNGSDLARDDSLENRAPVVRATLPGEEGLTRNGPRTKSFNDIRTSKTAQAKYDKPLQRPQRLTTTRTREFHLTKNSFLFPSHVQAGQGIHKYNKKAPSRLAIFVEKGVREDPLRAASNTVHHHTKSETVGSSELPLEQVRQNFDGLPKRPRATEAELAWRMKTWKNVDGPYKANSRANHAIADESKRSGTSKANQPVVTEEMLAILQEMSREAEESSTIPAAVSTGNFNTVSQAAHSNGLGEEIENMDVEAAAGRDDGYVFDTYVRAQRPERQKTPDLVESVTGVVSAIQAETVGVLVICEEDEREWQEFLQEESESDKEWDTDEEDENGAYRTKRQSPLSKKPELTHEQRRTTMEMIIRRTK